jgi:GNAT superfamily N-acetyltransferase
MAEIVDLRDARRFADVVADRIWSAWWAPSVAALEDVKVALGECLAPDDMPFTLVAVEGERFLGTASGIVSDLAARPQFSPWIAALWVEPEARGRVLGAALMETARARLFQLGNTDVFLCARPTLRGYYERHGWRRIEEAVGPDVLDVWKRQRSANIG